jgi:hypothetical protein
VLIAFTLFASYCLSVNLAIALHEIGHLIGCWTGGGKALGLVLAPQGFSGSYAARDVAAGFTRDGGYLLHVAGGVVFGAAAGFVLVLVARRLKRGTPGWIVFHATGTWSVGNNGAYLLLGGLYPFDDAQSLVELGVPRLALFLAGVPLVVAFLYLFGSFLRGIGLTRKGPYRTWLLTTEAGLLSYIALVYALRLWPGVDRHPLPRGQVVLLAIIPVIVLALATCTYVLQRGTDDSRERPEAPPEWARAGMVLLLGLLFMVGELRYFSDDLEAEQWFRTPAKVEASVR